MGTSAPRWVDLTVSRRRSLLQASLGAALAMLLVLPADGGQAQERTVTRREAAALARDAVTDDDALAALRAVQEIDGQPVDPAAATTRLGPGRQDRLTGLADALDQGASAATVPDDREVARSSAQRVLDDGKFQEDEVPRPFKGLLEWIADRLRPVGRFLDRLVEPILDLPGGAAVLGALIIGGGAVATAWLIGRRSRAAVGRSTGSSLVDPSLDPVDVERRADVAGAAGDLTGSIRLRYQAGLLRLVQAERLVLRPDTTATGAARQVDLATMDRLTVDFEEIVYGDRAPNADDAARARQGWAEVLVP